MVTKLLLALLCVCLSFLTIAARPAHADDDHDADRAAIRAEIETITQAFIDNDIQKIYDTHSADWSGFLGLGPKPIKGIDEYMKANGLTYPPPASYKGPQPNPTLHFKLYDLYITFVTPDVGVASFQLDYPHPDGKNFTQLRIMDVFAKRNGKWIQVASETKPDPLWQEKQSTTPAPIGEQYRKFILAGREAVWRAWFTNDREKLEKLIPDEAIAIDGGDPNWENRAAILTGAQKFADSGAKLTRLEFPRTEIQVYGPVIILFTTYSFDVEANGQKRTTSGSGIETFVRRGPTLVNTGWILAAGK